MKLWPGWLVVLAGACGGSDRAASTTTTANSVRPVNGTIERVVDGDTVDIDFDGDSERVRLIGIDTPETKKPNSPVECYGQQATDHTLALLPAGTPVQVVRDVEARDDYGRLLGYVYRSADGLFVNLAIVEGGYGRPLTIPPNIAFATQFVDAARRAEAADHGLWRSCTG